MLSTKNMNVAYLYQNVHSGLLGKCQKRGIWVWDLEESTHVSYHLKIRWQTSPVIPHKLTMLSINCEQLFFCCCRDKTSDQNQTGSPASRNTSVRHYKTFSPMLTQILQITLIHYFLFHNKFTIQKFMVQAVLCRPIEPSDIKPNSHQVRCSLWRHTAMLVTISNH